eukprot:scaffold3522_cov144-Skeletonema_menzelii.AAC.5
MTSDTGARIRFHGHYALAKEIFAKHDILSPAAFAQVDWPNVNIQYCLAWGSQVHNIAGTNQECDLGNNILHAVRCWLDYNR